MHKKLKLGRQTVIDSTYPVCRSYYVSCDCPTTNGTALCTITSVDACR